MRKLALALALTLCASSVQAKDAAYHRKAWIRKSYAKFKIAEFSFPCKWFPRRGTDKRFLLCGLESGPVSETLGEFGGVRDFKPWILVTDISGDGTYAIVEVIPAGADNSPQREDNPRIFNACLPVDLLPSGAKVRDSYFVNQAAFEIMQDWRTTAEKFQ